MLDVAYAPDGVSGGPFRLGESPVIEDNALEQLRTSAKELPDFSTDAIQDSIVTLLNADGSLNHPQSAPLASVDFTRFHFDTETCGDSGSPPSQIFNPTSSHEGKQSPDSVMTSQLLGRNSMSLSSESSCSGSQFAFTQVNDLHSSSTTLPDSIFSSDLQHALDELNAPQLMMDSALGTIQHPRAYASSLLSKAETLQTVPPTSPSHAISRNTSAPANACPPDDTSRAGIAIPRAKGSTCSQCSRSFPSTSLLGRHLKSHRRFACSKGCAQVFTLKKDLQRHENTIHSHLQLIRCEHCGREGRKDNMRRHMKIHERVQALRQYTHEE